MNQDIKDEKELQDILSNFKSMIFKYVDKIQTIQSVEMRQELSELFLIIISMLDRYGNDKKVKRMIDDGTINPKMPLIRIHDIHHV